MLLSHGDDLVSVALPISIPFRGGLRHIQAHASQVLTACNPGGATVQTLDQRRCQCVPLHVRFHEDSQWELMDAPRGGTAEMIKSVGRAARNDD
ncbi:hypothetical protein DPEC_G00100690 [Dallia pectoralis]|uniref:Uncharacterized protein n=1 Tax=Dallia pectoralis TaxID=75939 RepID=A0ACC2GX33_DALPE|nr:hypothetical protein DPEC_G00100690 [Dallia pectoralis]